MPSQSEKTVGQLDPETCRQIEEAVQSWGSVDSAASCQVQAAVQKWDDLAQPLMDAISASERLTQEDFAIRINTRD